MTDYKTGIQGYRNRNRSIGKNPPFFRTVLLILLLLLPWSLTAEPVWSGNASVEPTEFVNFVESVPLAGASSSFTRNTVVEVTNPQNGRTVEITIVKRAPRPGIFLVLSGAAGEALDFPSDQVLSVQVRVVSETTVSPYDTRFESADPDINPAVNLPVREGEPVEEAAVPAETAETPAADAAEVPAEAAAEEPEEIVLLPEPVISELPPETESYVDEPVPVPLPGEPAWEEPVTDVPVIDIPDVETPEETETEELPAAVPADELVHEGLDSENIIYFLTPSDFRPPEGPVTVTEPAGEEPDEIVPVYMDRDDLEKRIVDNLSSGASYIQLGAYSSAESVYDELQAIAEKYPLVVWTENGDRETVFKLLIGPLTTDETGVLIYRFRNAGYGDLFLYRP